MEEEMKSCFILQFLVFEYHRLLTFLDLFSFTGFIIGSRRLTKIMTLYRKKKRKFLWNVKESERALCQPRGTWLNNNNERIITRTE